MKKLEISGNYVYIDDIFPLRYEFLLSLNKLEQLKMNSSFIDQNSIAYTQAIPSLKNLQYLEISDNTYSYYGDKAGSFYSLDFLSGLEKITHLDLNSNIILNPSAITSLVNLESLNLSNNTLDYNEVEYGGAESVNSIGDLAFLSNLTKLSDLRLSSTAISNSDIGYLSSLNNLKYLDLRRNEITDVSPISHIPIEELFY